ncbi:TonB-dependent receptor, partial [Escherichia coli]|nr:TonB-dependent receptor [Escherichia coli]
HGNHLVIGGSFDHGNTTFAAGAEIGSFDLDRNTHGSGLEVDSQGAIRQVLLRTRNQSGGFYISDTFDITKRLSLTVSARY